ncbi:hypothetical protein FQZ97_975270 [compost metagenome]
MKLVPVGMGHAANVVNIEKIDFRKAETLLAVIEAAHDAIIAVIKNLTEIEAIMPARIKRILWRRWWQGATSALIGHQAANLGGNDGALGFFAQHIAKKMLASAIAIHWCAVEITDAAVPTSFQQSVRISTRNRRIKPTQRCSSQTKRGYSQTGTAKRPFLGCFQMHGYFLHRGMQHAALLFHRVLSKNRFALFGTRCLFRRLIGASMPKRNRKSLRMRRVYSRANKPCLTAPNSCRYYYDVRPI